MLERTQTEPPGAGASSVNRSVLRARTCSLLLVINVEHVARPILRFKLLQSLEWTLRENGNPPSWLIRCGPDHCTVELKRPGWNRGRVLRVRSNECEVEGPPRSAHQAARGH